MSLRFDNVIWLVGKLPWIGSLCRNYNPVPFPFSRIITRVTALMTLVEHYLPFWSTWVCPRFSGARVAPYCFMLFWRPLSFCPFSFGHCIACRSTYTRSDYPFGSFKLLINLNVSDSLSFLEVRVILIIEACLVTLR